METNLMKSVIDFLNMNYTATIVKGNVIWKRGTRKADNMKNEFIYQHMITMSAQQRNSVFMTELTADKDLVFKTIEEWIKETEEGLEESSSDGFAINPYIIEKFQKVFNVDDELRMTMRGVVGKQYFNSTQAAECIMSIAEGELNKVSFASDRVRRTIGNFMLKSRLRKRNESLNKILFLKEDDEFVNNWVKKLFDLYKIDDTELNVVMFKHMLYSIKRSVFGYTPPDRRFMYTFFNRIQGAGKSRFVRHICDPFMFMFTDQGTLDMLINKNDLKALTSSKAVIDIQELACEGELDKSAYAAIKAAITSETVGGRVLYSVESEEQPMLSVFVSSTNIHIADMIRDETGLRRFYSFDFKNGSAGMNWGAIDKHWEEIYRVYQSIDENGDAPLNDKMPIFAELQLVQEEYKRKSDFILDWQKMSKYTIHAKEVKDSEIMFKTDLFRLMGTYCKEFESFTLKMATLKNLLISRHGIYPKTDSNGSDYYYVTRPNDMGDLKLVGSITNISGFSTNAPRIL